MWLKRLGIVLAALIPVAIVGAFVLTPKEGRVTTDSVSDTSDTSELTPPSSSSSGVNAVASVSIIGNDRDGAVQNVGGSAYANGTYTAEGAYTSPAGAESITVTLTLANDVVTAVSVTPHGVGPSALWQGKFVSGIEAAVVGKSIESLSLTKVSGSSLTPGGFNAAVASIKSQAEV